VPELRKDPIVGRWVIISTDRAKRPTDFARENVKLKGGFCPFCYGNEGKTPPEIQAYRPGSNGGPASQRDTPGWTVRVVPNKFPALGIEGTLNRQAEGMFDRMNGIGAHEVIIETPHHTETLATMSESAIEKVFWAWRDRVLDLKHDIRLRYIVIFKNHGASAGATLEHAHSQLIALPIIPREMAEELEGAKHHYQQKERCVFCDVMRQELKAGSRVIAESADFVAIAPYAPRFPFETWLLPRRHTSRFEEATRAEFASLARMLKEMLQRMNATLLSPPYNLIVHSAPLQEDAGDFYHWHIELMPKLTRVAGF
jgi:UDPglucose--hexose-1-phosphate uridylyltransferase